MRQLWKLTLDWYFVLIVKNILVFLKLDIFLWVLLFTDLKQSSQGISVYSPVSRKNFLSFVFFRSVRTHLSSSKVRELDCLIDGWVDNKLSDISRATFSQIHLSGTNNLKWPNCERRWKLFEKWKYCFFIFVIFLLFMHAFKTASLKYLAKLVVN